MTPGEVSILQRAAADLGTPVTGDVIERIGRFLDVLETWNQSLRLTGERDRSVIVSRHVADSLAPLSRMPAAGRIVDIGSGAGFPGIVIACARPDLDVVLIESRRRRASFLGEVTRIVPLPRALVVAERAEDAVIPLEGTAAAAITRAVRLEVFLPIALTVLAPGGVAIGMQTVEATDSAARLGERLGFVVRDVVEYQLPDGRARALLVFRRTSDTPG